MVCGGERKGREDSKTSTPEYMKEEMNRRQETIVDKTQKMKKRENRKLETRTENRKNPKTLPLVATPTLLMETHHSRRSSNVNCNQMGKAVVDETEKGWYIQWVDRDPRLLAMQEAAARREKADLDDVEKQVCTQQYSNGFWLVFFCIVDRLIEKTRHNPEIPRLR